jgi:SAM-dependent methyltransferase
MRICGAGRTLVVGWPRLAESLWRAGVDAVILSPDGAGGEGLDPSRYQAGSIDELASLHASFEHVIVAAGLESLSPADELPEALRALASMATRSVLLMVEPDAQRGRAWWESTMFACGLRRHPLCQRWTYFASLDATAGPLTLIAEPTPIDALAAFPGRPLAGKDFTPTDALRDSGRESQAAIARSLIAAEMVRAGDVVLDVASGAGHGAWIIASGSEAGRVVGIDTSEDAVRYALANYRREGAPLEFSEVGDLARLTTFQNESVDLIAVMNPPVGMPVSGPLLDELFRVLSPGGRLLLCKRAGEAVEAKGWDWLAPDLAERFIPERLWRQVGGCSPGFENAARVLSEVPVELGAQGEPEPEECGRAEWWIGAAMKSPAGATREGYRETIFPEYAHIEGFDLSAFARDYDNPWLFRAMVCIGPRMSNEAQRVRLAREVLTSARKGSPDHGAAVCVLAYAALAASPAQMHEALGLIDDYDPLADGSPHAWRWRISNRYAAGKLRLALGDRAGARREFVACAQMDVLRFSPLLATKTVDAWCQAGVISLLDGDTASARAAWQKGLEECRRVVVAPWTNVWGEPARPHPYSLHELSQVIDAGSLCASWMNAGDRAAWQPGTAWMLATRQTFAERERLSAERAAQIAGLEAWSRDLQLAAEWHKAQSESWQKNAADLQAQSDELRAWNEELTSAAQWHAQERIKLEATAASHEVALREQQAWNKKLEEAKAWHESQTATWEKQAQNSADELRRAHAAAAQNAHERDALLGEQARLAAQAQTYREQGQEQTQRAEHLERALTQARAHSEDLGKQLAAQQERAAWFESQFQSLQSHTATVEAAREWFEGQLRSLEAHAASLEEARAWFENQRNNWQTIAAQSREQHQVQAERCTSLEATLQRVEADLARVRGELARVRSLRVHQFALEKWRGRQPGPQPE